MSHKKSADAVVVVFKIQLKLSSHPKPGRLSLATAAHDTKHICWKLNSTFHRQ